MATKLEDLKSLKIEDSQRAAPKAAKWSKRYIIAGVAAILILGPLAMSRGSSGAAEVAMVRATPVNGELGTVLSASGYIVAHHKITVNSKVTGRVAWIGVEKGDKVKEGQVIVRLEDQEFRANVEAARGAMESAKARVTALVNGSRPQEIQKANHDLDEARATLANDKINLERTQKLFSNGVYSKQQLDDALMKYESSVQRVSSLEQTYNLAKIGPRQEDIDKARGDLEQAEGQLAFAESQLEATQIRAPVTGTILERTAEKGELVTAQFASTAEGGPQGSVVAIADLTDIQVELDIAQDDFAKLSPHMKGTVTTDAYPDRKYNGEIAEISPEANRQKATVQVKVQIKNPDDFLRPDMNANVQFLADQKPGQDVHGALVPITAVRSQGSKKTVFLMQNDKAVAREVKVLATHSDGYVVDNLTGGETVIAEVPAELKDGSRIRVKK
jgi:HlyD family secretion protein